MELKNKTIIVMGYAMTGKSVARFLLDQGATVIINDQGDLDSDPSIKEFKLEGAKIIGNGHPLELLDEKIDFIIKNPGIPYRVPFLQEAIKKHIPIYTDVEVFSWFNSGKLIGITGSNGKTTTTSLLNEIVKNSPLNAHLAGNIGIPTLSVLPDVEQGDIVIMELSSFQLKGTEQFHPHISAITNLFEAHLDYHGSIEDYINSKLKLVTNQDENDYLVYNADDTTLVSYLNDVKSKLVPFSRKKITDEIRKYGAYYEADALYFKGEKIINVSDIQIPGEHNIENILATIAMAKLLEIESNLINQVVRSYRGVPYRIQPLGIKKGVSFFNDSKATNPQATITALKSFTQDIIYIGGGLDRGIDFEELIPYLDKVKKAYLFGESKMIMQKAFEKAEVKDIVVVDTLEEATTMAINNSLKGDVVLFSPSCASWDQFKNFEERGAVFSTLVQSI